MSATIKEVQFKYVEVGRVVFFGGSKLAAIVEIIDQKRVLIDGPNVLRQAIALNKVELTDIVLELTRGAEASDVEKQWSAVDVDGKWKESATAKKLAIQQKRAALNDFERFQVRVLKRQRKFARKIAA